jgi:hypothetical protein
MLTKDKILAMVLFTASIDQFWYTKPNYRLLRNSQTNHRLNSQRSRWNYSQKLLNCCQMVIKQTFFLLCLHVEII